MSIQTPLCPINSCGVPMVLLALSAHDHTVSDDEESDSDNHDYRNDNDCSNDDGSCSEKHKNCANAKHGIAQHMARKRQFVIKPRVE